MATADDPLRPEDFGAVYGPVSDEQKELNRQAVERAIAVTPPRTIWLADMLEIS